MCPSLIVYKGIKYIHTSPQTKEAVASLTALGINPIHEEGEEAADCGGIRGRQGPSRAPQANPRSRASRECSKLGACSPSEPTPAVPRSAWKTVRQVRRRRKQGRSEKRTQTPRSRRRGPKMPRRHHPLRLKRHPRGASRAPRIPSKPAGTGDGHQIKRKTAEAKTKAPKKKKAPPPPVEEEVEREEEPEPEPGPEPVAASFEEPKVPACPMPIAAG